jgi:hypothetical protein
VQQGGMCGSEAVWKNAMSTMTQCCQVFVENSPKN